MILLKIEKIIRTYKEKIVRLITNKAIIFVAIFFYLTLIYIFKNIKIFDNSIVNYQSVLNMVKSIVFVSMPTLAFNSDGSSFGGAKNQYFPPNSKKEEESDTPNEENKTKENKEPLSTKSNEEDSTKNEGDIVTDIVKNVVKTTMKNNVIGCGLGFFVCILGLALIMQFVSPITTIVDAVAKIGDTAAGIGQQIGGFLERLKNAILFQGFNTDERVLYSKINDTYTIYLRNYNIELDVPLIASTIFYDAAGANYQFNERVDIDGDGLPDVNDKIAQRYNSVETLASYMVKITEMKYICRVLDNGELKTYYNEYVSSSTVETEGSSKTCFEDTVGEEILEYKREFSIDNYYNKLKTTNILQDIYGDVASTAEGKEKIVIDIAGARDLWILIYGKEKKEDCPTVGMIPYDVLKEMSPPIDAPYDITSNFGFRTGEFAGFHNGIDVVPRQTKTIYSAAIGVVKSVYHEELGGNVIVISHDFNGVQYETVYAHLQDNSTLVAVGATVSKGQPIATMGGTGKVSGPHLHFQFKKVNLFGLLNESLNPENIFSGATNYVYNCDAGNPLFDCTAEGAAANVAKDNGFNFNIIRAIMQYESGATLKSDLLTVGFNVSSLQKTLNDAGGAASEVSGKIDFSGEKVYLNGGWVSFDGSSELVGRHELIRLIATVNEKVYEDVAMGHVQIKGSNYKYLGYASAKAMFEAFKASKYTQLDGVVKFFKDKPRAKNVMLTIGNMSDSEIPGAVQILVDEYKPGGPESWKNGVVNNYRTFRDDPTSTIDKYIGECSGVSSPDWADCSTFENKSECQQNKVKYNNKSKELLARATSPVGAKVLSNALSLWLKVRYCGWCSTEDPECRAGGADAQRFSYLSRCSSTYPIHNWYKEGFNERWSMTHTYNYNGTKTAAVAGLDCGGFVTWVMNHTFGVFGGTYGFGYVLNDNDDRSIKGACRSDTQYTKLTELGDNSFMKIAPTIKPGDVMCNLKNGRHVAIYMGYDDSNSNGMIDPKEKIYIIHTSDGTMGVEINEHLATGSYPAKFDAYYTYK